MHSVTPGTGGEGARCFGQLLARDGDALAQFNGRGFVVDPDEDETGSWGTPNL